MLSLVRMECEADQMVQNAAIPVGEMVQALLPMLQTPSDCCSSCPILSTMAAIAAVLCRVPLPPTEPSKAAHMVGQATPTGRPPKPSKPKHGARGSWLRRRRDREAEGLLPLGRLLVARGRRARLLPAGRGTAVPACSQAWQSVRPCCLARPCPASSDPATLRSRRTWRTVEASGALSGIARKQKTGA